MRRALLFSLLGLGLLATSSEAIVALCPNGFQNCDPYTGACFGAWTATKAGALKPDCATNPAACWSKSLTQCPDPLPPPTTPGAFRVCPWGVDCGVGYPPHLIDQYIPGVRAQTGTMIYYYQGHPGITGPVLPPSIDVNLVLDCILYHFASSPLGDGLACPPGSNDWSGRIVRPPTAVFEPAPACAWTIAPTSPVQPCELPQAQLVATMKQAGPTQWRGLEKYFKRTQTRVNRIFRNIDTGRIPRGTSLYSRMALRALWLDELLSLLAQLVADPPNANYQFLPQPSTTYPAIPSDTPDATMTAAQLAQDHAWLTALRDVVIVTKQLRETLDNLAGALVAAEAGTPDAALWVYLLATHWDAVAATVAQRGALEVAARGGITGPTFQEDAGCVTPTDAVNRLKSIVQFGSTLYGGHLVYDDLLTGPCMPAAIYPASMTDDGGADAAAYADLATVQAAAFVCAANPAYCIGATLSITPALDFGSVAVGGVSAMQTITVQNRGLVPLTLGLATLAGTNPTQYILKAVNDVCSGRTLAPQATCTIGIRFKPLVVGALPAKVNVPTTSPVLPVVPKVKLSGIGL